ncbi:hypothetical protein INT45_006693 [Circinella minor]|uniref:Uncharacterized protein n=1 Tax=Circinella minor TaxID=1195481 RepID=A0A8H7VMK0_9FUNG|nr:hypothetical protein INT45_006693 [Circinella minor]
MVQLPLKEQLPLFVNDVGVHKMLKHHANWVSSATVKKSIFDDAVYKELLNNNIFTGEMYIPFLAFYVDDFEGPSKPKVLLDFLDPVLQELEGLCKYGMVVETEGQKIPLKAHLLFVGKNVPGVVKVVGHIGFQKSYKGCRFCTIKGVHQDSRMTFPPVFKSKILHESSSTNIGVSNEEQHSSNDSKDNREKQGVSEQLWNMIKGVYGKDDCPLYLSNVEQKRIESCIASSRHSPEIVLHRHPGMNTCNSLVDLAAVREQKRSELTDDNGDDSAENGSDFDIDKTDEHLPKRKTEPKKAVVVSRDNNSAQIWGPFAVDTINALNCRHFWAWKKCIYNRVNNDPDEYIEIESRKCEKLLALVELCTLIKGHGPWPYKTGGGSKIYVVIEEESIVDVAGRAKGNDTREYILVKKIPHSKKDIVIDYNLEFIPH